MNAPSVDIADYLEEEADVTIPIFVAQEPVTPNDCLTIYDSPGLPPNDRLNLDYPAIQIRSRSTSYETAYTNLSDLKLLLQSLPGLEIGDSQYVSFLVKSEIMSLGRDENDRYILVCTMQITRSPDEAGNRTQLD